MAYNLNKNGVIKEINIGFMLYELLLCHTIESCSACNFMLCLNLKSKPTFGNGTRHLRPIPRNAAFVPVTFWRELPVKLQPAKINVS